MPDAPSMPSTLVMPPTMHMLTWIWDAPCIEGLTWDSDIQALAVGALGNVPTRTLAAAAAWDGYRRDGRGVLTVVLDVLAGGKFAVRYWRRNGFAQLHEIPHCNEFLELVDDYDPTRQVVVGVMGLSDERGSRFRMITWTPKLSPPEAYAQEQQGLAAAEIVDPERDQLN